MEIYVDVNLAATLRGYADLREYDCLSPDDVEVFELLKKRFVDCLVAHLKYCRIDSSSGIGAEAALTLATLMVRFTEKNDRRKKTLETLGNFYGSRGCPNIKYALHHILEGT